jgi:hypothetical protein
VNEADLSVAHSNSLEEMEVLEAASPTPLSPPPQFVLVFQDNLQTGEIDIAGVQRPEAFDNTSPTHVFGRWMQQNLPALIEAARGATAVFPQTVAPLRTPEGALVMGHSE